MDETVTVRLGSLLEAAVALEDAGRRRSDEELGRLAQLAGTLVAELHIMVMMEDAGDLRSAAAARMEAMDALGELARRCHTLLEAFRDLEGLEAEVAP